MRIPARLEDVAHLPRTIRRTLFRRSDAERALRSAYRDAYKKELNFENPRTFSEKMFHRMIATIRAGTSPFTELADKYLVRDYVRRRIGERYLVKLLWDGTEPRDIPFDALAQRCIIKTNHGSGKHVIVDGEVDRRAVIRHFRRALKNDYFWCAQEYQYHEIVPRLLIEEFIDDGVAFGPLDFRIWCFHGAPQIIQFDNHVHSIDPSYDVQWNKLDFSHRYRKFENCDIARPPNLTEMLSVAAALAQGIDFVRVDLYNAQGRIYFGELTFTPRAGIYRFKPESWDEVLGEKWRLGETCAAL